MGTPTIKAKGNLSIIWGLTNAANLTGIELETLKITPKNKEPIDVEGSAGFSAILVGLKDGFNATASAIYDNNTALPAEGATISLVVPKNDGANAGTQNVNCTFWSWDWSRDKKNPAKIELLFTHRPDINT